MITVICALGCVLLTWWCAKHDPRKRANEEGREAPMRAAFGGGNTEYLGAALTPRKNGAPAATGTPRLGR